VREGPAHMPSPRGLEVIPHGEDHAAAAGRRSGQSQMRPSEVQVRLRRPKQRGLREEVRWRIDELTMVEDVEDLPSDLKMVALGDPDLLHQRHVEVIHALGSEAVPPGIPHDSRVRPGDDPVGVGVDRTAIRSDARDEQWITVRIDRDALREGLGEESSGP